MKKGILPLKALLGLIIGLAFAVLILTVIFNVISIFFPDEDRELPDFVEFRFVSLIEKINELEEKGKVAHDIELTRNGIYLFFDEGEKAIKVQRIREVGVISRTRENDIRYVEKPLICEKSSCVCVCSDLFLKSESKQEIGSGVNYVQRFDCRSPFKCGKVDINKFFSEGYFGDKIARRISNIDKPLIKPRPLSATYGEYKFLEGGLFFDLETQMISIKERTLKNYVILEGEESTPLRIYLERKGNVIGACLKEPCLSL